MDLQKRLKSFLGGSTVQAESSITIDTGNTRENIDIKEIFQGWIFACTRAIGSAVAQSELKLYEEKGDDVSQITVHPILALLEKPNDLMYGHELLSLTEIHKDLFGNAFWYLGDVKIGKAPSSISILNPEDVKILLSKEYPKTIQGYKIGSGKGAFTAEPHQVIWHKHPNPFDQFNGKSILSGIKDWIYEDTYSTKYNKSFFENNAKLSGIMKTKKSLTSDALESLRKSFVQAFAGTKNAYAIGALPEGVEYEEMGQTRHEMDFSETSKQVRDKILAGFQVSKTVLGTAESDTNRATAEVAEYVFAKYNIKPRLDMLVRTLNATLVPMFGEGLYLWYVDPVPKDKASEMAQLTAGMAGQPVMSVNEARQRFFDLEPITNGDNVMTNFSNVPLGKPEEKKKQAKTVPMTQKTLKHAAKLEMTKELASVITSVSEKQKQMTKEKQQEVKGWTDDELDTIQKAMMTRLIPFETAFTREIKKFNEQQRDLIIENVKDDVEKKNMTGLKLKIQRSEVIDYKEQVEILIDMTTPLYAAITAQEGDAAAALIGSFFDPKTEAVSQAVKTTARLLAQEYNKETSKLVAEQVNAGIEAGESYDQISQRLKDTFEYMDEQRAELVSQTEVVRMSNLSNKIAYEQSGVVKTIKWYTATDERVCEYCGGMHDKSIDVKDVFFKKGDTFKGTEGGVIDLGYSDTDAPPLHPRCRCIIRPDEIDLGIE